MAPDYEKIIQKKVLALGQSPISWNKEKVWMVIEHSGPRKASGRRVWWLAAAAILIVAFFLIVQTRLPETNLGSRLVKLETDIEKLPVRIAPDVCEAPCLKTRTPIRPQVRTEIPAETEHLPVVEVTPVTPRQNPESSVDVMPSEVVAVTEERTVAPIIGYIPSAIETASREKPKRSKLKIFRYPEPEHINTTQESAWIVARINP